MIRNDLGIAGVLGILLPVMLLALMFAAQGQLKEKNDSGSFRNLADDILSGEIFEKKELSEIKFGRAVRTPGYPLIVVLAKVGFPDWTRGLQLIHLLIAAFSIIFLSVVLRAFSPPIITGMITVFVQFIMREYFSLLMTEWVAFNMLLILFGLVVVSFRNPSLKNLFIVGLIASLSVLVRPSLAPVMLLMPMLVVYRWKLTVVQGGVLAFTVLPLILWMSFNLYYLGAFKLNEHDGHAALGVGSIVGHANVEPGDSEELSKFITVMNEIKVPPKGAEDEFVNDLDTNFHMMHLESNIYWKAYKIRPEGLGVIPFDRDFLGVYGRRAIDGNPGNYIKYVLHGVKLIFLFGSPFLTLYLLVIPLIGLYRKKNQMLSWAALVMFAIHFGQGLLCAVILFVFDRYLAVTFYPYLAAILICFFGLLIAEGLHERVLGWLPGSAQKLIGPFIRVG